MSAIRFIPFDRLYASMMARIAGKSSAETPADTRRPADSGAGTGNWACAFNFCNAASG
ncbi:MAG: hypothetical protein MK369_09000 [SAR202 cluster bacterium]|nr:hypothetical protein [SAR202 cluster bacterium]